MTLITQPATTNYVHKPLIYTSTVSIPSGETIKNAIVTVTNLTTGAVFVARYQPTSTTDDTITFTANFDIDIRVIAQSYFCSNEKPVIFGQLDAAYSALDVGHFFDVDVSIQYEKVNTVGLLENIGVTDSGFTIAVINAARSICDAQDLVAFTSATDRRFLTNRPQIIDICLTDSDFLQYYSDDIEHFQVTTYNADGTIKQQGVVATGIVPMPNEIATFGTGVQNIDNIGAWASGTVNFDKAVAKYEVTAGSWNGVLFTPVTETMTYIIKECCDDRSCRLFWINRLGGVDGYTFNFKKIVENSPESQLFEKFLSAPFTCDDFGRQKYDSADLTVTTLQSGNVCADVVVWLRELQTSTRVYKAAPPECYAVAIRDNVNVISDPDALGFNFTISFIDAVAEIIQNNI